MPTRTSEPARWGRLALATIFCAYAAWGSRFWDGTVEAWTRRDADYASLRTLIAFDRTPILDIARSLDTILPEGTPVSFSPAIQKNGALTQRLAEGLYPRRTDRTATDMLALGHDGAVVSPSPDPARGELKAPERFSFTLDLLGIVAAIGAVLGFGLLLRSLVPALALGDRPALGWPVAWLAGCAVVGALVHLATWTQTGAPWWAWRFAGWLALGLVAYRRKIPALPRPSPEALVLVALAVVLLARMAVLPVTGWDGRSIWLFHAKQIFFQGKLALADLRLPDYEWSHPVYPSLVPGIMALFGGWQRIFNERTAALAAPLVWGGALAAFWVVARGAMGRWTGALVTLTAFFALEGVTTDLYMDGIVAALVGVVILSFADAEIVPLGILAASVVALVKVEGAAAALVLGVGAMILIKPRPIFLVPAAAPLVHAAWLQLMGVTEYQAKVDLAAIPSKLPIVARGIATTILRTAKGQQAETQLLLRIGVAGLAVGALFALFRVALDAARWRKVVIAGASLTFLVVVLGAAMPQDAAWVVTWTLDRLLLHPATAFAMLPFL